MNLTTRLKRIFIILFILNLTLLLVNVLVSKYLKSDLRVESVELSKEEVTQRFMKALHSYDMSDNWIKLKNGKDTLKPYLVDVPKDLAIPLLVKEISNSFDTNEVEINSKELKIRGATELKIVSGGQLKLVAIFNYNEAINRKSAEAGFIIKPASFDEELKSRFITLPEKFLLLLIPSEENTKFGKELRNAGKEYALLINDDISDLDYKLTPSYSLERMKISVKAILGAYREAVCYFYDPTSDIYTSSSFGYISKEFKKRGIVLFDYTKLKEINNEDMEAGLRSSLNELNHGDKLLLLTSAEDYFNSLGVISEFWKRGFKFINPSQLILNP